ncbi:hypothetical protein FDUTEX481_07875 [Tolypothrix sp. PCC 7601]|nr:hypothetical protein FDUTEX481_07875 [Tolypothrix sp. PCC 7601]
MKKVMSNKSIFYSLLITHYSLLMMYLTYLKMLYLLFPISF